MVLEGGKTFLVTFKSRAEFHCCADCDSDDFLMLNYQVFGGILAVLLFHFLNYCFKFLTLLQTGMYQGKMKDECEEVTPLRLKGPSFTSNHSKYLTCLSEANYYIIASFCTMHSRDVTG